MRELFVAFLTNPTLDSFRAIRDAVAAHPSYDGYSEDLREMEEAYEQNRFADVQKTFAQAQPNLLLSPGAHLLLSMALKQDGNAKDSESERFVCFCCVDGIQLTGDGTEAKPYLVLRTSDEYDMLSALGKQLTGQALIDVGGGRQCDKLTCTDGTELWFDVTDMMAAMARRMRTGAHDPEA